MNNNRGDKAYANQVSIVQASGTEKSRMLDEMAKTEFTIPFNLHDRENSFGESLRRTDRVGGRDLL